MEIRFHRLFKKQFKKLPPKIKQQFEFRLEIVCGETNKSLLRVHTLSGDKYPLQSMNVTGDYRALFIISEGIITFYEIGTHSELYE